MTDTLRKKLIVALDVDDLAHARNLVRTLAPYVGMFKIGHQLFSTYGPDAVRMVHEERGSVFLDLKYHDIPNTVKRGVEAAAGLHVAMVNVHASGGKAMMAEAAAAVRRVEATGAVKPIVLGVTILTSLSDDDLVEIGIQGPVTERVKQLALLAHAAGLDGVVASPREIDCLRSALPRDFIIVTPGVRPAVSEKDDQKRTMTPAEAVRAGADFIVVGRPIIAAPDPAAAAQEMVKELGATP